MADNMRKITPLPVDVPSHEMVTDLIVNYAHALDDGQIDLWPGFFTDSALYHITTRENHDQGLPIGIIRCSGRGMMADRVKAFHTANIFEPHCYNHLIGPAVLGPGKSPATVSSRCNRNSSTVCSIGLARERRPSCFRFASSSRRST